MQIVFETPVFGFPYRDLKFPGQATDEVILFVTREAKVMLYVRLILTILAGIVLMGAGVIVPGYLRSFGIGGWGVMSLVGLLLGLLFLVGGSWWIYMLWKRSVFILTNRRLTKFIYSTPWNRYNLSLSLDKVVDTGAYGRGYFQAMFGIGTFSARSSAGNRREKYFYIENVRAYEDLANYVNKVLFVYDREQERLVNFRPFIPLLKGEARKQFMGQFPEYWS